MAEPDATSRAREHIAANGSNGHANGDTTAVQRIANGANGHANGQALVATYVSDELVTRLAKELAPITKDSVAAFVTNELITALAKGMKPVLNDLTNDLTMRIAELERRSNEIENCVRNLVRVAAGSP